MPGIADVIKEKTEYLKGLGYSDAQLEEVAARLGGQLKKEKGDDLQTKDGEAATSTAAASGEATASTAAADPKLQETIAAAQAQLATVQTTLEAAKTELAEAVKEVKDIVTDLKVLRDVQAVSVKEGTPRESSSFIEQMLTKGSPIGKDVARIDGRTTEAKGPKEKEAEIPQVTGIPVLDQAFAGMTAAQQRQQ